MSEQKTYLEQVCNLMVKEGDLLVIQVPDHLSSVQRQALKASLDPAAERLKCELIILEGGITAHVTGRGVAQLAEQVRQTELLQQLVLGQSALVEALAGEQEEDPDAEPRTYLDGTSCR